MKKLIPVIAAVIIAAGFILAGIFFLPEPPAIPEFTSKPPVPKSIAPSGKPAPMGVPDPKVLANDFDGFIELAKPLENTKGTSLFFNLAKKQLLFSGQISCDYGRLEYLLVSLGGKAYESLIMAHISPGDLNVGCLAIGAKLPPEYDSRRYRGGEQLQPVWPRFKIEILYSKRDGTIVRDGVEKYILNQGTEKLMDEQLWAYTGSYFLMDEDTEQKLWLADMTKNICAIFYDSSCLLQNTDPEWHNDDAYIVENEKCPPVETGVLVLMTLIEAKE